MKKALQPNHQPPQKSVSESSTARVGGQAAEGRTAGNLGRLAATINQSPQVQTQLKLAKQLQDGTQNHKNLELAGTMNHAAAQRVKKDEKAQLVDDKKKPKQKMPAQLNGEEAQLVDDKKKPRQKMATQLKEDPAAAPNRTGLPDHLKAGVESLAGISMDDVRVHYNSAQPAQLNALAYAQGTDIHVAPGQEKHVAHEAWHIVQQKQGRVQPTAQMKVGVPINDDPKLEREADAMGAKAAQRVTSSNKDRASGEGEADAHAQACACPACSAGQQLISRDPAQLTSSGHGVAQLECAYCKSLGKDADHAYKNCPVIAAQEAEDAAAAAPAEEAPAVVVEPARERVPGWQRQGSGPTGRPDRSGIDHHDIGKDKSKSKAERDSTGGRKGKKRVYKKKK